MAGYWLRSAGVNADGQFLGQIHYLLVSAAWEQFIEGGWFMNCLNIGMHKEISTDDRLIIIVVVEDYTFDHMFAEYIFYCDDNWAMGVNDSAIRDFDFATYWELE
uniref:Uncharacterized protein n=1 Tax=Romanomermis culicivorax TaxID=13658 RepID=A0A915JLC0_ROMCU